MDIIHKSGGLSFLAHTLAYSPTIFKELDNLTSKYDFDGLECFYTTFSQYETSYLLDYCSKHNLYRGGGSDFHGTNKVNHNMGIGAGNLKIEENIISNWNNPNSRQNNI